MILMFLLWVAVLWAAVRRPRWVPALTLVTLVVTGVLLRLHMTSSIPLNF